MIAFFITTYDCLFIEEDAKRDNEGNVVNLDKISDKLRSMIQKYNPLCYTFAKAFPSCRFLIKENGKEDIIRTILRNYYEQTKDFNYKLCDYRICSEDIEFEEDNSYDFECYYYCDKFIIQVWLQERDEQLYKTQVK